MSDCMIKAKKYQWPKMRYTRICVIMAGGMAIFFSPIGVWARENIAVVPTDVRHKTAQTAAADGDSRKPLFPVPAASIVPDSVPVLDRGQKFFGHDVSLFSGLLANVPAATPSQSAPPHAPLGHPKHRLIIAAVEVLKNYPLEYANFEQGTVNTQFFTARGVSGQRMQVRVTVQAPQTVQVNVVREDRDISGRWVRVPRDQTVHTLEHTLSQQILQKVQS